MTRRGDGAIPRRSAQQIFREDKPNKRLRLAWRRRRYPESHQTHGVIDANAAGMPHGGPQRGDKGSVAAGDQGAWRKCRQSPILPNRIEQIRRRANLQSRQHAALFAPRALPLTCMPTARSAIKPMRIPASMAFFCASAKERSASHCRKAWKSNSCSCPPQNPGPIGRKDRATRAANLANSKLGRRRAIAPRAALRTTHARRAALRSGYEIRENHPPRHSLDGWKIRRKGIVRTAGETSPFSGDWLAANRSDLFLGSCRLGRRIGPRLRFAPWRRAPRQTRQPRRHAADCRTAVGRGIGTEIARICREQSVRRTERKASAFNAAAARARSTTPDISPMPQSPGERRP